MSGYFLTKLARYRLFYLAFIEGRGERGKRVQINEIASVRPTLNLTFVHQNRFHKRKRKRGKRVKLRKERQTLGRK